MTHTTKVMNYLSKNTSGASVAKISHMTKVPRDSVRKRINDLRKTGVAISSTYKNVGGKRKVVYQITAPTKK